MNYCTQEFSLAVSSPICQLSANDWLNNPGTCRLRVKNFNAADWNAAPCVTCNPSGGLAWDGTFPLYFAGIGFGAAVTVLSFKGKDWFHFPNVAVNAGHWGMAIECNPFSDVMWSSDLTTIPFASGPVGVYNQLAGPGGGCIVLATVELEAYIP